MPIQRILCNPPLSIARLGGSDVPMDAFSWSKGANPHIIGETQLKPEWTLRVESDGSVTPVMPTEIALKDNGRIRPVAPFVEIWCDVGDDGDEAGWERQPLTTSLLSDEGLSPADVNFAVLAVNMKAARRTGNRNHRFGTASPVTVQGDDHASKNLAATSLTSGGATPMIPPGRTISMGSVQVIRPSAQPADDSQVLWADEVNVETTRLRITPGKGQLYGPPGTAEPITPVRFSRGFSAVEPGNDFLDPSAGWAGEAVERLSVFLGQQPMGLVSPGDTYDGAETTGGDDPSLGIIDDTCEIEIVATLDQSSAGGATLEARANVFSGPPDFAPDRRPFLSLADSIIDRAAGNTDRSNAMSDVDLDRWIEDLFERAYETTSLLNVDLWRDARAATIPANKRRQSAIDGDATLESDRALGGLDELRDGNIAIPAPTDNEPLPLTQRAHERHSDLSNIVALKRFIREKPDRLEALIRKPFFSDDEESFGVTTMQMPPFMRNSNAGPLTLTVWQYDLLMEWQRRVLAGPPTIEEEVGVTAELSAESEDRRQKALERLQAMDVPL